MFGRYHSIGPSGRRDGVRPAEPVKPVSPSLRRGTVHYKSRRLPSANGRRLIQSNAGKGAHRRSPARCSTRGQCPARALRCEIGKQRTRSVRQRGWLAILSDQPKAAKKLQDEGHDPLRWPSASLSLVTRPLQACECQATHRRRVRDVSPTPSRRVSSNSISQPGRSWRNG